MVGHFVIARWNLGEISVLEGPETIKMITRKQNFNLDIFSQFSSE